MISRVITMDGSAQRLSDSFVGQSEHTAYVNIQNPSGNNAVIVGQEGHLAHSIAGGTDKLWPERSLKNIFFQGTNTEVINVTAGGGGA